MSRFDGTRINEMDKFLDFVFKARKSLESTNKFNVDFVYSCLCNCYLKYSDRKKGKIFNRINLSGIDNREYFRKWINEFKSNENIEVFNWPNGAFCQFQILHCKEQPSYIKIYVPLDYKHLYDGANMIFDYLSKSGIWHSSKIANHLRSDNIVIRLKGDDTEGVNNLLDFIKNNKYIMKGLNKTNPFIPTINGIGIMNDLGNSYNLEISNYIYYYIEECIKKRKKVSAEDFKEFIENSRNIDYWADKYLYKQFYDWSSSKEFNEYNLYETFCNAYYGVKKNDLSTSQKGMLIIDCLKVTFEKYGINQVKDAIFNIIENDDYTYITNNGENLYREKLKKNVSKDDMKDYLIQSCKSREIDINEFMTTQDMVDAYCDNIFYGSAPTLLDDICRVTLENHGIKQLQDAITRFINTGKIDRFSRFKNGDSSVNYREKLSFFNKITFLCSIDASLYNKGIDSSDMSLDDKINCYVTKLEKIKTMPLKLHM